MQVFLRSLMAMAYHAPIEQTPEVLNRIGVDGAVALADVPKRYVIDALMALLDLGDDLVSSCLIGNQDRLLGDRLVDGAQDYVCTAAPDRERLHFGRLASAATS
jgi:hypothetical protein